MALTDDATRTVYSTDNSIYQVAPAEVVLAGSAADIAAALRANHDSPRPRPVVARGAGTGTNGQSLTDGIMIDLKRGMHRIVEVDAEARTAVVEPGVVTAELNAHLAPLGLHWAPHTSTLNRCTVGGMIATDAAGKGSLVHGRTHRHVLALDVLLADGTAFRAEPTPLERARELASGDNAGAAVWRALLDLPIAEGQDFALPELARGFSGYGIDRFRRDGLIDPVPLLVGSEGTLAVVTRATLSLTPLPRHTRLIVASYPSFTEALADAVELRSSQPTAIETFDEQTLDAGRASPAWPALGQVVGDLRGSVLLLEYTGDEPPQLDAVEDALRDGGRALAWETLDDAAERADAWKVRADAVGLLAKVEVGAPALSARPTAMVEDCAVPVAAMSDFIADFRAVLDGFGVQYGMFGHADVGCVHVRPALDTTDPEHETLVRSITDAVVEVLARHGGILWGEHGRGFRGESVEVFLSADTIAIMRQVKSAFDPTDLLNPGKLYRPIGSEEPLVALDSVTLRGHANRAVPVDIRREHASAFACNGNGLCHHYDPAEVMCPSYKATRDPALSPKGRADLLREWLRREQSGGDAEFEQQVADNLGECLSCSACTGRCPVEVDIPELKSQFLERHHAKQRRPVSHRVLSRFEQLAAWGARAPWLARIGVWPAGRVLGLTDLPSPKGRAKIDAPVFRPGHPTDADVVVLPDVFSSYLESETARSGVLSLENVGYRVAVAPFVPSGKFDHVKGRRAAFAQAVRRQADLIEAIRSAGAVAVAIEPATGLLHSHEYSAVDIDYPSDTVLHLAELLAERSDRLPQVGNGRGITLLGHCTERATRPGSLAAWRHVLESAGFDVDAPAVGCCGMAGIFGHESENQALSRAVWDLAWADEVAAAEGAQRALVATGYSCRSQAARFGPTEIAHPANLLIR